MIAYYIQTRYMVEQRQQDRTDPHPTPSSMYRITLYLFHSPAWDFEHFKKRRRKNIGGSTSSVGSIHIRPQEYLTSVKLLKE